VDAQTDMQVEQFDEISTEPIEEIDVPVEVANVASTNEKKQQVQLLVMT
jgi:hypothetical protein